MRHLRIPLALSLVAALAACGSDTDDPAPTPAPGNIVQVAQGNADLSILVEAVLAADADVAAALSGPGPLTVFAPTNAAFAALLGELQLTKAQLLADKPLVTAVLKYHVLGARVLKAQIPLGKAITPLQGGIFKIDQVGADFVIKDGRNRTARITATDVAASNGTVHLVDKVILPADKNIVQTAQGIADFSILVEAVLAADADVAAALSGPGPLTVFAPTNAAFAALLGELQLTKAQLLADKPLVTAVLKYHVISGRVLKADVVPGVQPATVQGQSFSISAALAITDGRSRTAGITATDVLASNGVIHVIDRVILPTP
jgi:uncharacterized surface protein with fasciclin (FAS1) repeats